jgi:septation ring formation regulator EzrA
LFFWFFFGHSPTFETVVTTIFAGFLFHVYHRVDDVNKRLTRVEVEVDNITESLRRIEGTLQKKRK